METCLLLSIPFYLPRELSKRSVKRSKCLLSQMNGAPLSRFLSITWKLEGPSPPPPRSFSHPHSTTHWPSIRSARYDHLSITAYSQGGLGISRERERQSPPPEGLSFSPTIYTGKGGNTGVLGQHKLLPAFSTFVFLTCTSYVDSISVLDYQLRKNETSKRSHILSPEKHNDLFLHLENL